MNIVYETNSGSTKRYAEMMGKKLDIPVLSLEEALKTLPKEDNVLYLGWVMANKIQGLKKAKKRFKLVCACAVGMNPASEKYSKIITEANSADCPLFYLRGTLDYSKLNRIQKMLLNSIRIDLEKQKKPGTEDIISLLRDGGDFVSEESLSEVIAFMLLQK